MLLDQNLLCQAQHVTTGANVHRVKEMIFLYEQAVDLYNRRWPSLNKYQAQHERRLRCYVLKQLLQELKQKAT